MGIPVFLPPPSFLSDFITLHHQVLINPSCFKLRDFTMLE
jgi:hypothetical protein